MPRTGGVMNMLSGLTLLTVFAASTAWGQTVPHMRTRKLTSMTNVEIEEYLKRNNVIIIPVGPIEMLGESPVEAEYVGPLGWSIKMAEKADALVFPHFVYCYPGGTVSSRATFYMSMLESSEFLLKISQSLVRQGFRRFFFVSGHGPAEHTIYPVVRELYEKYGVPAMETSNLLRDAQTKVREAGGKTDKLSFGLYQIAGQLEDLPLESELPEAVRQQPPQAAPAGRGGRGGTQPGREPTALNMGMGNIYVDASEHGRSGDHPRTAEIRAQYAKEGVAQVEQVVAQMNFEPPLRLMDQQIKTYREVIRQKYGDLVNFDLVNVK
jgi:creatinine amidohydrolase